MAHKTASFATSIFNTPTTYTAVTSKARSECQYVEQTFTSPYTVTMFTNNCSDDEIYTTFTTTVTSTATGPYAENDGDFTYATATVGVYSTETLTDVLNYYTTIAPSFSIAAPLCQSAGCVQEAIEYCGDDTWSCTVGPDCDLCTIYGGTVQLLYWPVSATTSAANGSIANTTSSPTVTEGSTTIYEGYTLVSPSVYISFATAYALNDCNSMIGQAHTGSIIGLDPSELSSAVGNEHYLSYSPASGSVSAAYSMAAAPFNLANLNWPYNPLAYLNQPSCNTLGGLSYDFDCAVILEGDYNPVLVVPDEVRSMDPAWASCAVDWEGLYDPPSALQPATAEASPTPPNVASSTEAAATTLALASAGATRTTGVAEISPATLVQATSPNSPAATADDPTPSAAGTSSEDETSVTVASPTSAGPSESADGSQADPGSATTVESSTTGIGDLIASVTGLVPSAIAAECSEEVSGGQATAVGVQNASSSDKSGSESGAQTTDDPGSPEATAVSGADGPGQSDSQTESATNVASNGASQVNNGGTSIATFVAGGTTHAVTQIASNAAVIDGNTLSIGGSAVEVADQTVSLGSAGIVAANGGTTSTVQFAAANTAASAGETAVATFVVAGTSHIALQADGGTGSTAVLDFGATLSVGGPATTLAGGQTVSLAPNGIIVNDAGTASTAAFIPSVSSGTQEATFVAGGTTYTAVQAGGATTAVLGGATLSVGGPAATLADGETVSLGPEGIVGVGGGSTTTAAFHNTQATSGALQQATFAIDGTTYTALEASGSEAAVIDGQALSVNGPAITIDGQVFSLASNGIVIAGGEGTSSTASFGAAATAVATFVVRGKTHTALELEGSSVAVIDGQTLSVGGSAITVDGETVSLGTAGLVVADDGTTSTASFDDLASTATPSDWISEAIITAGSSTFIAYGVAGKTSEMVLDGTTLKEGGSPVTINGDVFSLGPDGLVESGHGQITTLTGVGILAPASKSSKTTSSGSSGLVTSPASRASTSSVRETGTSTTSEARMLRPRLIVTMIVMMLGLMGMLI